MNNIDKTILLNLDKTNDEKLKRFHKNFERLIFFIKNRGLYDENSQFYNEKISEINEIIWKNNLEKYDKESKKIIVKKFGEILSFLEKKHNLHRKNKFLALFLSLGIFFWMIFSIWFYKNYQNILIFQQLFFLFCISIWLTIDKKIEKDGRQIPITLDDK